jgi:hypothetical protein
MGFNRRKLEDQRCEAAEKEAASRRAKPLEDATVEFRFNKIRSFDMAA